MFAKHLLYCWRYALLLISKEHPTSYSLSPRVKMALAQNDAKLPVAPFEASVVAGSGASGYEVGKQEKPLFEYPTALVYEPQSGGSAGRLYVADSENKVIRAINLDSGIFASSLSPCSVLKLLCD
jgi:hypothetical protein